MKTFKLFSKVKWLVVTCLMLLTISPQVWGATETLTWALTSNTNCSGGTNVSGGSVTPVNGSTYKAGTWSISSSKYQSENKNHNSNSYWEDLSSCSVSGCADPTTTARLEFPITINSGYSFNLTGISLSTFEQQSGGGPVIQVYVVQGSTKTWVGGNYTKDSKPNLDTLNINLSAGTAKVVFILGVTSNLGNGRGFKFAGLTVTGTSTASGGGGDVTAPTLSSSSPSNGATGVATSGTIVLTFSEAIESVDGSKFTLTNATKVAVAIDGSDATKVNIDYSGASNSTTVTLATAAGAVSDAAGNSSAALSNISFTTVAACTNVGIGTQPTTPVAATVGSACSITGLVASGTNPTYQWQTCNSDGSSASNITSSGSLSFTGYTTATLGLTPTATGATYYKCVVSGDCGDPVTSSVVTVNASAPLYTVIYDVNGGGSVTPTSATQASSGASLTLPTPTWSGYTFDGWYSAGTKIGNAGASYTPTADITLYAKWTDNISGKVFSFIDNNYGDKFKDFKDGNWVTANATGKSKTYTNGTTGVQYVVTSGAWDSKSNAISALAKLVKGTTSMSVVIPTGKIATVKISYNAYGTGDDYRLTVNGSAQANPSTKLADGNTNAQVISNMKEITLSSQTGTLTLSVSGSKNDYIGRVSAVITGYVITYDKGTYGTGTLAGETKTPGSGFTLSSNSTAFTRDGYTYDGWSTNADGSTKDYNLGGSYTTDAAITLYPHWVADAPSCSNPADPTGLSAGSITSSGATFTIEDAANTNNYEIVCKTTSGTPAADATPTQTGTSKTIAVTGLNAYTDYYAYVRAVCDASHKSNWVALTGSSFKTLCEAPTTTLGNGAYTVGGAALDLRTLISSKNSSGAITYSVTNANGTGATIAGDGYSFSATTAGTASISATQAADATYCEKVMDATITVSAAPAGLVAIEANTLYQATDMLCSGMSPLGESDTYFTDDAYSTDNRFYYDVSSGNGPKAHTVSSVTLGSGQSYEATFTSEIWVKGTSTVTDGIPSAPSIKFLTPSSSGILYLYIESGSCPVKFKKVDGSASNITGLTQVVSGKIYSTTVEANSVYYIYGNGGSNTGVYGLKLITCSTPAAPTAFANTAVTSTTATFSITDAADAASYDLYYASGSPSTPTAGTAATENVTTKTPTIEGLTASTTYKIWVRSVCDASHKSDWVALTGTSFTTSAAEPDPLVSWTMNLNTATWGAASTSNHGHTEISSIATSRTDGGTGSSASATAKVKMASAEVSDASNPSDYAAFTFTINAAKKVEPEKVTCEVFNVSTGNRTYKAQISDSNGHVYNSTNTVAVSTEATLTPATFTFASDLVLTGDVTVKIYAWKTSGSPTDFRMGESVKLFGEVQNAADYTVTHTLSNVTKSAGATSVKEGNNYTATYAGAGGCALPSTITVTIGGSPATAGTDYTWTQGTGVVSIPGDKVTGNIVITVTGVAVVHHDVTFSLTNVVYSSGDNQGTDAATEGVAFSTVFTASSGYDLPSTITVTIGGSPATVSTDYTWNHSTGALEILAASVTGDIVVTIVGPEHVTSDCITIAYFETTAHNNSSSKPDNAGKYIYGYTNSAKTEAYAYTITSSTGDNKGQGTGESDYLRMNYGTTVTIYADNTTTGGTPASFSNVTSVSVDFKMMKSSYYTSFDIYVGATKIADNVSLQGDAQTAFTTFTYDGLAQLSGKISIVNKGAGSSNYHFYVDNIEICTASMDACTTPVIPSLSNQALCEGANAAAWDATVTNAAAISAAGETVSYQWQLKDGSSWDDISGATSASYDVSDAVTEAMAGTYRVVVTVSKAGYSSSSATREVTLSVAEATEVTGITADKATVYPTNSVTLTATANTSVTWQWYTCTNAEGAGESSIGGATSAAYTIASAGAVGTYYYKVKATGSCGTASAVYTLTVSPAASSEDCFHFVSVIPTSSDISVSSNTNIVTPTHATTLEGGTMKVGSQQVNITQNYGLKLDGSKYVSITLDNALEAGNVVIVKGTSGNAGYGVTINGVNFYNADNKTFDVSYTVVADDGLEGQTALTVTKYSGNSYLQEIQITGCGVACSDPEVTASVDNGTICVGGSVTFTAANAHASATYQWQKYSGSAWTNISGAESATYTINPVAAGDETKYRVIANHDCNRTSNEVTLNVAAAPVFGDVPASVSVMQTLALSISTVEASDATGYKWYKSADATWDAGDTEIGEAKNLIKAYASEAIGSPSYYVFCRATNSCGTTTSSAIAVNVTTYVEEDCAIVGNGGEHNTFAKTGSVSSGTYGSVTELHTNSNNKYISYVADEGYYFKTATVNCCAGDATVLTTAAYSYSTDGGTNWTDMNLPGAMTNDYNNHVISSLPANVNAFRVGRVLGSAGTGSNTLYIHEVCFTYSESCTSTTVTPSTSSVDYTMGGEWTDPTFTLGPAAVSGETLTYSSSNEDIASVDDEGVVTFNGDAGTVTITASYAGGEVSSTQYCASEGSYTITVSCSGGAPKVVADGSVNMSGCNSSVTLHAKQQDGTAFADGTYQWFRNGTEIDGATSSSYTTTQAGTYTVERTNAGGCTTPSTNNAVVTSETTEPEVERLVPFQYYHVDKTYTAQMKIRHLFAVKNSSEYGSTGRKFKLEMTRNGGAATDVTSSNAIEVWSSADRTVDTVMIDLNKLNGKYSEDDELVFTCKAVDCDGYVSNVYKNDITMHVIGEKPTLALICSGSDKANGTRKTGELTVGGDFLTGYNKADLCEQTGNTSFNADAEWGLYTRLKANYIVTPVNGYAVFNKLNYEPFDILLLTDYPKASKSDAAATVLDDMADLVDFRPMLSLKAHMVSKTPSKWAAKGFTTSPVHVTSGNGRTYMNIVCYAHPMFDGIKEAGDNIFRDHDDPSQIVYEVLTGPGYESSKGLQGFEIDAAENFVTIGLIHYNATATENSPSTGELSWAPGSKDRMLVAAVERQTNLEARLIVLAVNCGAQSKFTETGRTIVHKCLEYLLSDATDPITPVADCSFTFDNGEGYDAYNETDYHDAGYTGTKGDGKWSTAANWGPDRVTIPGQFTSVRIAAPVEVDMEHAKAMEVRLVEGGSIEIPAGKALDVKSTIRRMDGTEISPTEVSDIHVGTASTGNGTLIFNNNSGDSKAQVDMYSKGFIDGGVKNYQYIGTPFLEVNALYNYYGSWIYSWGEKTKGGIGWVGVKNGGPMSAWTGYCITQESPTYYQTSGTLTATGSVDIPVPAGENWVVGNSWTAPIDINALTTDDLEGLVANIYFFNTGVDKTGEAGAAGSRYARSTYVTVPVEAARYEGEDDHINSLQGFFVKSNGSAGVLHLDYERHVRGTTRGSIIGDALHAPARRGVVDSSKPTVLKIKVSGNNYDDRLLLLERADFSAGFDNGWDGDKWDGNASSLYIYTKDSEGTENSVSAIPELNGTIIGFRAGEDDAYTMHFELQNSDDELYLLDLETNAYTRIQTGHEYMFTTSDKEKNERFIITRESGHTNPTAIDEIEGGKWNVDGVQKVIYKDHMYIIRGGRVFDARGAIVK